MPDLTERRMRRAMMFLAVLGMAQFAIMVAWLVVWLT